MKYFILATFGILISLFSFAQTPLNHLIYSKSFSNSLSSCEVYISTNKLQSEQAIISFVMSTRKPETVHVSNTIAEGWVNLIVAEDATVDYERIKYYGGKYANSQANQYFNPEYNSDKYWSKIAGHVLAFTPIGGLLELNDFAETINDYLNGNSLPKFDANLYDQIDLPFNAPNKFAKIQIDIPVSFGNNTVIGIGALWEVLGHNREGKIMYNAEEYTGIINDKFNILDKINSGSAITKNTNTKGTFTDPRDGHTYKWVKIGEQVWMAENLAYKTNTGSWAYNNNENNVKIYGRLYNWETAKQVCPPGWHLSTDDEWYQLAKYVYSKSEDDWDNVGKRIKATIGWNSNGNGIDDFGFSGLPGGSRVSNGSFSLIGDFGYWWRSGERNSSTAWSRYLNYNSTKFIRSYNNKKNGFSVRCVRD